MSFNEFDWNKDVLPKTSLKLGWLLADCSGHLYMHGRCQLVCKHSFTL